LTGGIRRGNGRTAGRLFLEVSSLLARPQRGHSQKLRAILLSSRVAAIVAWASHPRAYLETITSKKNRNSSLLIHFGTLYMSVLILRP
jgi:hypothetical protein